MFNLSSRERPEKGRREMICWALVIVFFVIPAIWLTYEAITAPEGKEIPGFGFVRMDGKK
jgi:hypothetical protein